MNRACARVLLALCLAMAAMAGRAQPLAPQPVPPDASVQPVLGAPLPLDLPFTDSEGRPATLRHYLGDRPLLLVLGYYRCPQLCGLVMHGLLDSLHRSGLPRPHWRILRVSIDPQDTPAVARARRDADLAYAHFLEGADPAPRPPPLPLALQLLTGPPGSVQALAQRVGYRYQRSDGRDDAVAAFAHPAVVIVVTPAGRVSRYLGGVQFDPQELRLALTQAGEGRIGTQATLAGRVALLCAHLDSKLGRHSAAVLRGVQAMGVLLVLSLVALGWRPWTRRHSP